MARAPLPIANGFYVSGSLPISAQECTNWYVNVVQTQGLSPETLFGTPGITPVATSGGGRINVNRGSWDLAGVPYFVNGTTLYRLESDLITLTALGTITGTGRVWMSDNGTQLCILVPGTTSTGYIFTTDPDSLVTIVDADFKANGEPQSLQYIDGYFQFNTSTSKFIISALNDGTSYNALDFGSAEVDPDNIVSSVVFRNQLFIAGTETLEVFQNIGGADFPFSRTGLFVSKGVISPFAIVQANDNLLWVGAGKDESPAIWSLSGNLPEKVSSTAIDTLLQTFTLDELSGVFGWSYSQNGAYFTAFSLPTTTIVYDTINGRWHERKSQLPGDTGLLTVIRSRVNSVVTAYGKVLVGDSQDGRIGFLDPATFKEYEFTMLRPISTQPFQNNMNPFFVSFLELTVESGMGNNDVVDPKIRLEISSDGGKTYKYDQTRRLGKKGEYGHRVIWRRLGRFSRFAIFRFTLSDAVKPVIIQLTADIK